MSERYALNIANETETLREFVVFQRAMEPSGQEVSLAWYVGTVVRSFTNRFSWTADYQFVWARTGPLRPGVIFRADQVLDASLQDANSVDFTELRDGGLVFENLGRRAPSGALEICTQGSVPYDTAAIGINMTVLEAAGQTGSGVLVSPATPNLDWVFRPPPRYWIGAGAYQPGEVLDVEMMPWVAEIVFPAGVSAMEATWGENGWTIAPA